MEEAFTIRTFIDNRWADAKAELLKLDDGFVAKVEALDNASKLGLLLLEETKLPEPSVRLSSVWHDLLAATFDIVQRLDSLEMNVSLLDPKAHSDVNRRIDVYHFEAWVQRVYNLCDIVNRRLITLSSKRYFKKNGKANSNQLSKKYISMVKSKIQNKIGQFRHELVHGAGGNGSIWKRVITDEYEGWEVCVVGGAWMIEETLKASYQSGMPPQQFFEILKQKTEYVTTTLGEILKELEEEIELVKQAKA